MQKLKSFSYTFFLLILVVFLLTLPTTAKYFQSNLVDYIKNEREISVPLLNPKPKLEIKAGAKTTLVTADGEKVNLEENKLYIISQSQIQPETEAVKSGWGIQLQAYSTEEKALAFKNKIASEIETELLVFEEDGLFKVIAGSFSERSRAEKLEKELENKGYPGWPREFEVAQQSSAVQVKKEVQTTSEQKTLKFYNAEAKKLKESSYFELKGDFETRNKKLEGDYYFRPLADSVLFSYQSNLEEMTAYLLQNYFEPAAPIEALKAQAVLYRTALLYQLEVQGARLENLPQLNFNSLNPAFLKAIRDTQNQVLIKGEEFYYNNDYSLKNLRKPKTGIIPLAQADYDYQEIINYYYQRSELADLNKLLDSELKFTAPVERGLKFKEIRQLSWSGPRLITVIDYDLKQDNLSLKPVLARGAVPGREDLGDLIKKHGALAGVNGGYFHYSGRPLGLLYINGKLVSEPLYNRSALLISEDKEVSFAQVDWAGELIIESLDQKIKLDGVNRKPNNDEIILFNHFYGAEMPVLPAEYYDIVVRDDKILGVENEAGTQTPIPVDGFVLRVPALRSKVRNLIPKLEGTEVTLNYNLKPNFKEKETLHAVGGGPRLLKDGEIDIKGLEENFQKDILNGRAPRTAVALTAANHLLFITVDGRQKELSVGMTLDELAQTLKDLGAVEAINLDGGGSARMVIRGFTMSNPSEKRLISNGVIVDQDD